MRRVLNPTVALITFFIGVFAAALWLTVQPQGFKRDVSLVALPSGSIPLRNDPEAEKYAVYSALIRDMYVNESISLLVIDRKTGCLPPSNDVRTEELSGEMEAYAIKKLPEVAQTTIDDFRVRAKECHSLDGKLEIPIKYVLVSDRELESLFPEGEMDRAWRRFYDRYPKSSGIINFSNVGFNPEMSQAFVATSKGCGGLCGEGNYVLLVKENGVWRVQSKAVTWVS